MKKKKLEQRRSEFKEKIIILLKDKVSKKIILKIKNSNSKSQVKKILCELTEHHAYLRENNIKRICPQKKKKKISLKGAEFDRTINSVRTISTPMGNKR